MSIANKLTTIAENQQKVYDAGYTAGQQSGGGGDYNEGYNDGYTTGYDEGEQNGYLNGQADGYDSGIEAGKQAEYDRFWDAYQDHGNRADYENCFSGVGWTDETFKPKYDIVTNSAYMLFRKTGIADLGKALRDSGKRFVIDANIIQYTFNNAQNLEVVDGLEFTKPITRLDAAFSSSKKLRYVQTLPISPYATQLAGFGVNDALETISFSGTIPVDLNMGSSPKLNKASIENIIGCLSDTATGKTLTLSKAAVDREFGYYEDGELLLPGTEDEPWSILVATKPNWTISLV